MRRGAGTLLAAAAMVAVMAAAAPVCAHDYERGNSDHPLRYVAYLMHPFGIAFEYGVLRWIHKGVSQPHARIWFGHNPRNERDEYGRYPVCAMDRTAVPAVECPHCHKPLMKPPDEYWVWK